MNGKQKEYLNEFFVHVFNQLLSWEEQTFRDMGLVDLTLRELHVIEAVSYLEKSGKNNMASVAKYLSITPGSLTTSVNLLVKKEYLQRCRLERDRRVVAITPTEKGIKVNEMHKRFHSDLIEAVGGYMEESEINALIESLEKISIFISGNRAMRK